MTTSNNLLAAVVLRVVLPLVLTACTVFRPCGLSLLYLLLLLYLPLVPVPKFQTFTGGHTGRYLKVVLFISFLTVAAQFVFQVVLLSLPPYGDFLINCQITEKVLRHLGLVKLNDLQWLQVIRWLGPDAAALIGTITCYVCISNFISEPPQLISSSTESASSGPNSWNKILNSIGVYITLGFLCITSSLQPSVPSSIYYLVFLGGATWWALSRNIRNRAFARIFSALVVFLAIHVLALYLYQLEILQELLDPASLPARLLGLVQLMSVNCDNDPRVVEFNSELHWVSYSHPFALLFLFHLLVYEAKTLFSPEDKYGIIERGSVQFGRNQPGNESRNARLIRRQTVRWHGKSSRRVWNGFPSVRGKKRAARKFSSGRRNSVENETTPLMTFAPPRSRYSSTGRSYSGEGPSGTQVSSTDNNVSSHSRGQSITSRDSCAGAPPFSSQSFPAEVHELYEYDGYALLLAGLTSLFDIFAKSSYVATNIIMMVVKNLKLTLFLRSERFAPLLCSLILSCCPAWSITYHSWLTFILLLWACILWMFPNQRKAMLVSSPGLVVYAELLLLAQYVYSLNLTDDELPVSVNDVNFAEIGLVKSPKTATVTILVKSLYTMMFWITLRQFVMERKERETTVDDAAQESFRIITVSTTTTGDAPVSEVRHSSEDIASRPGMFIKVGNFVKEVMTKFWIWVVAIMLFVIGLGGDKVVLYRIVYMALFLVFVLTFQLSYGAWRKMMYGFWLTVIIYSMLILVLIYIYQFKKIPGYLTDFGIPIQLQKDIGLESYDTGSLFVRLLTPTFFVIITVVQLHYFHKDFLKLSEMSRRNDPRREISPAVSTEEEPQALIDEFTLKNLISNINFYGAQLIRQVTSVYLIASEIVWRFLEIHIMKIVLFSAVMLAVNDKCALHFVLFLGVITAVVLTSYPQRLVVHLCSIFISSLLLVKMIYQIDFIQHYDWESNCTINNENITRNDAEWLGLYKIEEEVQGRRSLPDLLKGYIGMVLVLTIQAVINIRQNYQRYMTRTVEPLLGILFSEIQRQDADKGLLPCLKFLFNYGFYKFGVELTLITMVAVIGTRLDLFSVLYAIWLIPMFFAKRQRLTSMWVPFILFVAILLPIQYLSCVGVPPFLCWEYPWIQWAGELKIWLFLPDIIEPPLASRLIPDFFLLLFACQQQIVFRVEKHIDTEDFRGGSNREITELNVPPFLNPTPDFLTYTKTWLDVLKRCILLAFFWITLAIIFLTGTNRVNLFALGYLVGSFTFLWEGNEFYLRSRKSIIKRWNYLLAYNVFVIFSKSLLQLVGCVFLRALQVNFCWFVQLFGIACLNKFRTTAPEHFEDSSTACSVPTDEAGLMWDGITFAFLVFQRRIFNSYYFFHIRAETEAQAKLASRGAELIEELMQKQIKQQEEQEKEVLEKIKMKMDRIKATHQGRPTQHQDHFDAIRSGDYYMFDENEDDELEMIDSITEEEDDEDQDRPAGVTLSELMSSALKTDVESATEMARQARRTSEARDRDVGSLTDSTTGATSTAAGRRRSKKRASKRSALSFRSDRRRSTRVRGPDPYADVHAPLAMSDGEGGSSAAEAGGGGDGEQPSTSQQVTAPPGDVQEPVPPPPRTTFMRRLLNYLRFAWAFLESVMISATNYLNKFSRDYRHVSKCLAEEKLRLKEQELNQTGPVPANPVAASTDKIDFSPRPPPKTLSSPVWDSREDGVEPLGTELPKQLSTEESDLGGSGDVGSKDDLQTVVEKPSPQKETDFDSSLDKISISDVDDKDGSYPIVLLVTALWYVVISHSDVVCYFVVFLNQIKSASVLSLPLPLMVLFWGSLSVPRPTKTFWVTIIAYTEALVVIKYLFQFNFFPWNETNENKVKSSPFWPPRIMGVEQQEKYAVYDVTLLMVVFFHRFMLKSLGLWKNKGTSEDGTVYYSEENPLDREETKRMSLIESGDADQQDGSDATATGDAEGGCARVWEQWELQDSLAYGPQVFKLCAKKYLSSIKLFFDQILNLEYKVKVDVYSYMFICDFFNFLVVIFGFASFGSQSGDVSSYLEENKVPVPFLVMVILQFGLIVVDRALYLRKYIFGKFLFQMFLVTLVHGAMFFVLPGVTERTFNAALPPQMWYMVKCIYLLFSAYQIRSGYPTRILGNFLCKKYNYVNMFLFKGFMAVPFLFELRALMDWIWTDTSMTLSDWLKLEDIFAHIFQLKCQRRVEKEYPQGRGMPKARWTKYSIGGSALFVIIAVIWFPLVLFALGNTVGISIPPHDVTIELTIGSYQPIFKMSAQNSSLMNFQTRDLDRMNSMFKDKDGLNFLNNYETDDIMVAQLSGSSTSLWGISPPAKEKLIDELNSTLPVAVVMSWAVSRESENPTVHPIATGKYSGEISAVDVNRQKLITMINGTADNTTTATITGIFPKFLRVVNNGKATVVTKLNKGLQDGLKWSCPTGNKTSNCNYGMRNLVLRLQRSNDSPGSTLEWWELKEDCPDREFTDLPLGDRCKHLNLYTFNEKAFPPTLSWISGGGIIGLYTTLVLVASKFVRSFFAGISFLIMFDDMPNVDRIFQLCLDIYLVRESGELALEEDLFAKLIFLYRSPETLIKWTRLKRVREPPPPGEGQAGGENVGAGGMRAIQQ